MRLAKMRQRRAVTLREACGTSPPQPSADGHHHSEGSGRRSAQRARPAFSRSPSSSSTGPILIRRTRPPCSPADARWQHGQGRPAAAPRFRPSSSCRQRRSRRGRLHRLYLHSTKFVRWKRLSAGANGHRPRRLAMSPVHPPATTVGEPGIFANVTHDRTVVGFQSYAQGRLP